MEKKEALKAQQSLKNKTGDSKKQIHHAFLANYSRLQTAVDRMDWRKTKTPSESR